MSCVSMAAIWSELRAANWLVEKAPTCVDVSAVIWPAVRPAKSRVSIALICVAFMLAIWAVPKAASWVSIKLMICEVVIDWICPAVMFCSTLVSMAPMRWLFMAATWLSRMPASCELVSALI